jgi:hypothetical protein
LRCRLSALAFRYGYVASVEDPGIVEMILALIAMLGFLAAYLLVAQSSIEPDAKGGNVIAVAVVSAICFAIAADLL